MLHAIRTNRALLAVAIAAMVTLGACDDSTGVDAGGNVQGTYNLKTVNGQALPFVLIDFPGFKAEYLSGSLDFKANNVVTSTFTARLTENGVVTTETDSENGTYAQSGSTITFTFPEEDPVTGTVSGNRITVSVSDDVGNFVFVFEK